jgi:hypothetical protein
VVDPTRLYHRGWENLPLRDFKTHAQDVFVKESGDMVIIGVDPGIETVMACTREFPNSQDFQDACNDKDPDRVRSARTKNRDDQLARHNRDSFEVSNKEWRYECGRKALQEKNRKRHDDIGLQQPMNSLADAPASVGSSADYVNHILAVRATLNRSTKDNNNKLVQATMKDLAELKAPRRGRFGCYQKEQRAVKQLSQRLLQGIDPDASVVVVWGNGGFGPTYRGHASAPNKKLRRMLSQYVPIMLSSEWRSSKRSACCHGTVEPLTRVEEPRRRSNAFRCLTCHTLLGRDRSAACVIVDIFKYQRQHQTAELPAWITD